LRILKAGHGYIIPLCGGCCRDIDPVEDTERSWMSTNIAATSTGCRDIDPVEDTERSAGSSIRER